MFCFLTRQARVTRLGHGSSCWLLGWRFGGAPQLLQQLGAGFEEGTPSAEEQQKKPAHAKGMLRLGPALSFSLGWKAKAHARRLFGRPFQGTILCPHQIPAMRSEPSPAISGELKTVMPHFKASIHTTHDEPWLKPPGDAPPWRSGLQAGCQATTSMS